MADGTRRVLFVCTGNICRSPMAETVLRAVLERRGLAGLARVDSAGTAAEIGWAMDVRAIEALERRGYVAHDHRARQVERSLVGAGDLVVALDRGHLAYLRRLVARAGLEVDLRLLRSFAAGADRGGLDVPDPYYGGPADYDDNLDLIEPACAGLADELAAGLRSPG